MADWWRQVRSSVASRIAPKDEDDESALGFTARGALGTIADVVGIVSLIVSGLALFLGGALAQAIMALALSSLTVAFMVLTFGLQRKFARESKRALSGPALVLCHRKLRDAAVALYRRELAVYTILVAEAAAELAGAFSTATDHPCRIAIQDVAFPSGSPHEAENAEVRTICRSFTPEHGSREHGLGELALAKENTDFLEILNGSKVFYSNDIARLRHYTNSHFDVNQDKADYPYRSTIVWPIVGPDLDPSEDREQIIGFLCVDAERPGVFTRHLDVPTGKAVASALYSSLSLYRALRESEEGAGDDEADT